MGLAEGCVEVLYAHGLLRPPLRMLLGGWRQDAKRHYLGGRELVPVECWHSRGRTSIPRPHPLENIMVIQKKPFHYSFYSSSNAHNMNKNFCLFILFFSLFLKALVVWLSWINWSHLRAFRLNHSKSTVFMIQFTKTLGWNILFRMIRFPFFTNSPLDGKDSSGGSGRMRRVRGSRRPICRRRSHISIRTSDIDAISQTETW